MFGTSKIGETKQMSQTRNPDSKRFQLNMVESRRGGGATGRETPVGDPLGKGEHPQRTKTERTKKKEEERKGEGKPREL
jgi:hypothetical protein